MRTWARVLVGVIVVGAMAWVAAPDADAAPPELALNQGFVTGLDKPWDMAFLPDKTMFFTERSGPISVRLPGGTINQLVVPEDVLDEGSGGGMLGLAIDPQFASNRYIYTCHSSDIPDVPETVDVEGDNRLVRWTVNETFTGMDLREDIVTGLPYNMESHHRGVHSGCRPRFKPGSSPRALYIGTGDAATGTNPQDFTSRGGKILRVTRDGLPYPGNPGLSPGAPWDPLVLNRGHRNVQGIAFQPGTNRGYSVEHGPGKKDEVNRIKTARNYGWDPEPPGGGPGYDQTVPMTDHEKFPNAVRDVWNSGGLTYAPSGATFLDGPQWKSWDGRLALAILDHNPNVGQHLRILKVRADGSINRARDIEVFADLNTRLRSAVQGPDGKLYIATDVGAPNGAIWKVKPK